MKKSDGTRHFTNEEMEQAKVVAGMVYEALYRGLVALFKNDPHKIMSFFCHTVSMIAWAKDLNLLDFARMEEERDADNVITQTIEVTEFCQELIKTAREVVLKSLEEMQDVQE